MNAMPTTLLLGLALAGCTPATLVEARQNPADDKAIATTLVPTEFASKPGSKTEKAIFAAGCFWGPEFHFRKVPGITATAVGYIGGKTKNPTYFDICYKNTGHAEAVILEFDPAQITYRQLVDKFWMIHNPCTLNRQGPDVGDQYRSEIFYLSPQQKADAEASMKEAAKLFKRPIVTKITAAPTFYFAEVYHQQYAAKTGKASCPIDFSDHNDGG